MSATISNNKKRSVRSRLKSVQSRAEDTAFLYPFVSYVHDGVMGLVRSAVQKKNSKRYRYDSRELLEQILENVLLKKIKGHTTNAFSNQKELLENVVYLVLNHTPPSREERDFVAWINSENISYRPTNGKNGSSLPNRDDPLNLIIKPWNESGLGDSGDDTDQIRFAWENNWAEYLKLNDQGWSGNERTTWNEFLLNRCEQPLPVGVTWAAEKSPRSSYVHLPPQDAKLIGLKYDSDHLVRQDSSFIADQQLTSLDGLVLRWHQMQPAGQKNFESLNEIEWTVFQLIKFYGCWGGNSFVSIPITFGSRGPKRTSVLSICTKGPITEMQIAKWTMIAQKIFTPLASEDAISEIDNVSKDHAYRRLGHALKTFTKCTGWENLARAFHRKAKAESNPETKKLLTHGSTGCALFSFSAGLGGLLRLDSILTELRQDSPRRYEEDSATARTTTKATLLHEKLSRSLDVESYRAIKSNPSDTSWQEQYFDALKIPVKAVCKAFGIPKLRIETYKGKVKVKAEEWSSDKDDLRLFSSVGSFKMQPFREDSEMHLVFFTAVVEPMINAAKYLETRARLSKVSPPVMRIYQKEKDKSSFCIWIGNPIKKGLEIESLGLIDTKGFIESTGIAEYQDSKKIEGLNDEYEMFFVPIRFNPLQFADEMYHSWKVVNES